MRTTTKTRLAKSITLGGREVKYNLVESKGAKKLRVRIGPRGIEVLRPTTRTARDAQEFLLTNQNWVVEQVRRIERLKLVRRRERSIPTEFIFRGKPIGVDVSKPTRRGANKVSLIDGRLAILRGKTSQTHPAKSLEYWLRRQARQEFVEQLDLIARKLKVRPRKVFVREQRTKWGNCSAKGNLSFNWRLILGPDFVLRYIVAHEATHLRVPDHSQRFWLTVQGLCPQLDQAKQWLRKNGELMRCDLKKVCCKSPKFPHRSPHS